MLDFVVERVASLLMPTSQDRLQEMVEAEMVEDDVVQQMLTRYVTMLEVYVV